MWVIPRLVLMHHQPHPKGCKTVQGTDIFNILDTKYTMKILLANIGGSSGYSQVMKKLLDIENPDNIPDTLVIQECGSSKKFNGLEPFFKDFKQSPALRLHFGHSSNLLKTNFHKTFNICSIVFKVKTTWLKKVKN